MSAPLPPPLPGNPAPPPPPPPPPAAPAAPIEIGRDNPWPGLRSYDESMHDFFFGRETEVEELLRLVRRDAVALFYGQSGLGKSSVLQAGLFPKLRANDFLPVRLRLRYAADSPHPVEQILQELVASFHAVGGEAPAAPPGTTLFEYFYDERHEFWSARNRVLTPVLIFDQFEEIFTLGGRDATTRARRTELLAQLAFLAARKAPPALVARFEADPSLAGRFAADTTRCRMLFSMREDFLPELGSLRDYLPTLPTLVSGGSRLKRLNGTQAREVLERPGGHLLEPGAAERIIRFVAAEKADAAPQDLGQLEVEPALLSVVADELNKRRRERGLERISADLVQGAHKEILSGFYERALRGFDERVRTFIEEQLLTTTGFRDSVALEDAEASFGVSRDVINQLVEQRLLRIDERFQLQRVELTHDLLTSVVKTSRDRRHEREDAAAAQRKAEDQRAAAEQAAAAAQAKLRRTRRRAVLIGALVVLSLGFGGFFYIIPLYFDAKHNRDEAERNRLEAETARANAEDAMSRSLLEQANTQLGRGAYDAARLLLALGEQRKLFDADQASLLAAALDEPPVLSLAASIRLPDQPRQVEFAPAGRMLELNEAGALQWIELGGEAAATSPASTPLAGALGELRDVRAFDVLWTAAPVIAAGSGANDLAVYDLATGARLVALPPPETAAEAAPAESSNADGHDDDAASESRDTTAATETHASESAATVVPLVLQFSPDGKQLAALLLDGRVVAWRSAGGWRGGAAGSLRKSGEQEVRVFATSEAGLAPDVTVPGDQSIRWSTDGSLMVTAANRTAWLTAPSAAWKQTKPIETFDVTGVRSVVNMPPEFRDPDWFAAPRHQNKVYWLQLPAGAEPASSASVARTTVALPDTVHAIAAAPGTNHVFIAFRNGTIAAYRTESTQRETSLHLMQLVTAPRAHQIELRLRPDGQFLAAITDDGLVQLYRTNLNDATPPSELTRALYQVLPDANRGLWQIAQTGEITGPDKASGSAKIDMQLPDARMHAIVFLRGDPSQPAAIASLTPASAAPPDASHAQVGLWSFHEKKWLWTRAASEAGLNDAPGAVTLALGSPDASLLAVGGAPRRVALLSPVDGAPIGAPLEVESAPQWLAWSGDSQHLAVLTDSQEVLIFDLAEVRTGKPRLLRRAYAPSVAIAALALDEHAQTIAYAMPDARLILGLTKQDQELPLLIVPLSASAEALAFVRDAEQRSTLAVAENGPLRVRSGRLPPLDELEWLNQSRLVNYRIIPFSVQEQQTQLARLDRAAWQNDASVLVRDTLGEWTDWVATTTRIFLDQPDAIDPAAAERARARGEAMQQQLAELAAQQPGLRPLLAAIGTSTSNLDELSRALAPKLTPLQRWPLIAFHQAQHPDSDLGPTFARNEELPALLERLEKTKELPIEADERAQLIDIVRMLASSESTAESVWENRAVLTEHLFPGDEWEQFLLASPGEYLLEREATTRASNGDYEESSRLYAELAQRFPDKLIYKIRRGLNLRHLDRLDEALALFNDAEEIARAQDDGEVLAETLVYRAWTLLALGRADEANKDMETAAAAASDEPWTVRSAVRHFVENGLWPQADQWSAHLLEIESTATSKILRARVLMHRGDIAAGRDLVTSAVADSEEARILVDAGELLRESRRRADKEQAEDWLHRGFQKTRDSSLEYRALMQLGIVWSELNRFVSAVTAFKRCLQKYSPSQPERANLLAMRGWIESWMREFDPAIASLKQSLELEETGNPMAWVRLANCYEWTGRTDEAVETYQRAAAVGDSSVAAELVAALVRFDRGDEADRALAAAFEKFPNDRELRLWRARRALASAGDHAAAAADLAALDDGTADRISLQAAALRGEAAAAAERHSASLDSPMPEDFLAQAGYRALAWQQTHDAQQRELALNALSEALQAQHRGNIWLRFEFGLGAFTGDPLFELAEQGVAAKFESGESVLDLARFEAGVAAAATDAADRETHRQRAIAWVQHGIDSDTLTRARALADPALAPLLDGR